MREINEEGLDLIEEFEGCKLRAYQDQAGVWTIGYGTTELNHPEIRKGYMINEDQAELYLKEDLQKFYVLDQFITDHVNDNQYSALICLAYNVGLRAVRLSQTLRLINEQLNPDKEWLGFNKINGEVSNGLTRRREAELRLYHKLC